MLGITQLKVRTTLNSWIRHGIGSIFSRIPVENSLSDIGDGNLDK